MIIKINKIRIKRKNVANYSTLYFKFFNNFNFLLLGLYLFQNGINNSNLFFQKYIKIFKINLLIKKYKDYKE